jgi:hypothetical protein
MNGAIWCFLDLVLSVWVAYTYIVSQRLDASAGSVVGPGTKVISLSLLKRIQLTEASRMEIGAQVSNVGNHPNYNPPGNLIVGVPGFGALTSMQTAEGAGPRAMQLVARITF